MGLVGLHGSSGSVWDWVMGNWLVGQKMYGLYGLKHHTVEISGDVTDPDGRTNKQQGNIELLSF